MTMLMTKTSCMDRAKSTGTALVALAALLIGAESTARAAGASPDTLTPIATRSHRAAELNSPLRRTAAGHRTTAGHRTLHHEPPRPGSPVTTPPQRYPAHDGRARRTSRASEAGVAGTDSPAKSITVPQRNAATA